MNRRVGTIIAMIGLCLLVGIPLLRAQQPSPHPDTPAPHPPPHTPGPHLAPHTPAPYMDPLHGVMFPPELIMGHARELALTDQQKTFMRGEIQRTTTSFLELQWQLQDAMEALHQIMKSNTVEEQQALAQLDKVLDTERQIKRLHFSLGIRLKNQLTPEQQGKLRGLRMGPWPEPQPIPHPRPDEF